MVKDNVQRDLKWLKIGSKDPIRTNEQHMYIDASL
jgi:hypothetical protein